MKLTAWEAKGYKSISDAQCEISDLTVLIGKNNSGKSNIIDSMRDFREAYRNTRPNRWVRQRVIGKNTNATIELKFKFELSEPERDTILDELSGRNLGQAEENDWLSEAIVSFEIADSGGRGGSHADQNQTISANWDGEFVSVDDLRKMSDIGHFHARLREEIKDSIETWKFMAPFRNPDDTGPSSHTSEDLDSSGQNLVRKLNSLRMTDKRYIFDETRESYIDVMEGVSNLDIRYDLDVGSNQITVEVEEEGFETTFKSEEISSGSKEILALLTQIHLAREDTDLLAIEEPELHLHPEAERKVYRMIEELVEDYDTQVILSTHSDVFVNQSEPEGIIRVERDRTTEVRSVEQGEIQEELADLGYSKSGLLQSDAVVFVEGLSDKLILSEWAATLGLNVAEEGITVVELEGEGNVGTHGRSLVKLVYSFDIPYLFIVDSDDEDPEDVITQHKRKINREDDDVDEDRIWWYTTPDHFHAWSDSDIEYFLLQAPAAIADIVDEDEETIRDLIENTDADDNIDVLEAIWEECYTDPNGITSYQKGIHGKMIAKQMDETQIDEEVKTVIDEVRGLL